MNEWDVLSAATGVATTSPCLKSQRGVIIWSDDGIVASGRNTPPLGFRCDGSEACRASCGKVCVHAEQDAILACLDGGFSLRGMKMLHVKVVDGEAVAGGPPSCPDCSKLILAAGLAEMWLYEITPDGPRLVRYPTIEFHSKTLQNCGLHPYHKS